jgi:hypothetical protein
MLFSSAEFAKPKRIQGAYLSDSEINDVVNYIKDKCGPAEYLEGVTDRQKVGGNAGVGLDGNRGDEDELFEAAKELIVRAGKASTSMLQRRLSIGYGRAAKILDMLEEAEIIGPSNGAKPREVLISQEQYEAVSSGEVISGVPIHDRNSFSKPDSYLTGDEGNDDILVFKSDNDGKDEEEEGEETEEEIEEELNLTPDEIEEKIDDEDEILKEIREEKKTEKRPSDKPKILDDDDEMFFAR